MEARVSPFLPLDLLGIPVPIANIERELAKLWDESNDHKSRASLINLMLYTEDRSAIEENTETINAITAEHACRVLLVLAEPHYTESSARAWIGAHCHFVGKGSRQLCSEQITFHLQGQATEGLSNLVFSHLDSDLPLVLWWQSSVPQIIDVKFWRWVDRVLYDSATWDRPSFSLARIREIADCRKGDCSGLSRITPCDLAWTRLQESRFAFANLFDQSASRTDLESVVRLRLFHSPLYRIDALLFLGWVASCLGWRYFSGREKPLFIGGNGKKIPVELESIWGGNDGFLGCELLLPDRFFRVERKDNHFLLSTGTLEGSHSTQTVCAKRESETDILLAELGRSGSHPMYFHALDQIEELL